MRSSDLCDDIAVVGGAAAGVGAERQPWTRFGVRDQHPGRPVGAGRDHHAAHLAAVEPLEHRFPGRADARHDARRPVRVHHEEALATDRSVRGEHRLEAPETGVDRWVGLPRVTTAVVAVCSGSGLEELFAQLGVQGIVTGGQTLNPSTAELLDAVAHVNADQVIVLPNNKNIIPVAEQLDALSDKSVRVVATRSMPEALAALVVYDPEADADDNLASMSTAIDAMVTGEVTRAVRDAASDAGPVTAGDWKGRPSRSPLSRARCAQARW